MTSYIEDYFRTTFATKLMVHMPEREDDHLTPATKLLEKRREMAEVDQALSAQKEEFQMKMESLEQRREELERKELQLKESLLKFDKFLKENDSKKARAIKKAADERDSRKQKDKDIERLKAETDRYNELRGQLQARLRKNQVYQKFMDGVLESSDDFQETREIIARFDTLTFTKAELLQKETANQTMYESIRADMSAFIEEKNNDILRYNNMLSGLQQQMDRAHSKAVEWEGKWNHVKNTASAKTLLMGKVKMAIHNLYLLALSHQSALQRQAAEGEQLDSYEQLDKLTQYITDLTQVVADIKKQVGASETQLSSTVTQ